jgi:hypothetical protein
MTAVGVQRAATSRQFRAWVHSRSQDATVSDALGNEDWPRRSRYAIISDLCPAATHLSYNFNFPFDDDAFESEVDENCRLCREGVRWMYRTFTERKALAKSSVVLWSDVFVCNNCNKDIVFWDALSI